MTDDAPVASMQARAARLLAAMPQCVGLSIWRVEQGVTSTVVALDRADDAFTDDVPDAAVLDAVQYVGGGPGVDAGVVAAVGDGREPVSVARRWPLFAAASAGRGVRASLAVPLLRGAHPVGVVVVYASAPQTLDLVHAAVRDQLAPGDVRTHDGPVRLLHSVGQPPEPAGSPARVALARATGLLESEYGIPVPRGERRLLQAAARAGIPVAALVEAVVEILEP